MKKDFKDQFKFFSKKISLTAECADQLFSQDRHDAAQSKLLLRHRSRLFKSFKLKTNVLNSQDNFFSDSSLQTLCQTSRSSLEELTLRNVQNVTASTLATALASFSNLKKLDLSYNDALVTDSFVQTVFGAESACRFMKMKSLSLRFNTKLSEKSIKEIVANLPNLENLDVSGCMKIPEDALCVLRGNRKLKTLLVEHLKVTGKAIEYLSETGISTLSLYSKQIWFLTTFS